MGLTNPGINVTLVPIALSEKNGETKLFRFYGTSMGILSEVAVGDQIGVEENEYDLIRTLL
jgi:hypothetical protein